MLDAMGSVSPAGVGLTEFKKCLRQLNGGDKTAALSHIRLALKSEPKNPFYLSYEGMLCAIAEKRYVEGENLCREALQMRCNHAQLYLNLAELFHQEGRDGEALATLRKGFISAGRDKRIRRALEKMGGRRPPILSMFGRGHSLNRMLGRLRHLLIGLYRSSPSSGSVKIETRKSSNWASRRGS
jgi:tetratricopeptide (TPR) repeat protein